MDSPRSLLSNKDCDSILHNCLKRNNVKVVSYTVKSLSDKIEGFLGDHFFVTIEYEEKEGTLKTQRCFMKVLNGSSKLVFEISQSLNAYNKEDFFYTFLLKEFEKYNIDTSFAPRSYFCKPYLIVLEDLSQRNFTSFSNVSQFLDLDHCKVGLRALAKLHSSGLLYELAKSKEEKSPYNLEKAHPDMFQEMLFLDDNLAHQWFKKSIEAIFDLIPYISESYDINENEFTKSLGDFLQNNENFSAHLSKFKGTVLHGDLWYNNFLFKYENNIPFETVVFDFQLLKYGPPAVDVLHFLYTNTRKTFRDKYFDCVVDFYYEELASYFTKPELGSLIPKEQYLQLCQELQIMLKLQCICDRSVTLLVSDSKEVKVDDDTLRINLFQRRSERVINCFNNNDFFREIIAEDMIELYNMLMKS